MLSFYTIWCRFQSSVFSVNRFRMLLWFLYFCFLCVKQCLIRGLFALWLFNSKNKLCQYSVVSDKFFVLPLVLWSNCLQIAYYRHMSFAYLSTILKKSGRAWRNVGNTTVQSNRTVSFLFSVFLLSWCSLASHCASKFLFDSRSKCHDKSSHSTLTPKKLCNA